MVEIDHVLGKCLCGSPESRTVLDGFGGKFIQGPSLKWVLGWGGFSGAEPGGGEVCEAGGEG